MSSVLVPALYLEGSWSISGWAQWDMQRQEAELAQVCRALLHSLQEAQGLCAGGALPSTVCGCFVLLHHQQNVPLRFPAKLEQSSCFFWEVF